MPTSDFSWDNLPPEVLHSLADALDLTGDPGAAVSKAYGPQPSDELVRAGWSVLRESWLALDSGARGRVVNALGGSTGAGEMDFLRSKSNAKRLREVVAEALLAAGCSGSGSVPKSVGQPAALPSLPLPSATQAIRASSITANLSLGELERRLWDAANSLRGPVDPADFKTYVFPMLFWKWISDTWDHEHAEAVADYGEDIDAEVEADYHRFTLPEGTRWRQVTTKTDNIGSRIGKALGTIEQSNPDRLAGIFGDAAWGNKERLPEASLVALINAFTGLDLNPERVPHDVLGQAYEYLLKNFADESGKKAGEFFTPRQVVRLIVKMLDPQPGESTYDPACGSGGMLVETINAVRERGGDTRTLRLYGQEVNLTTAAIARMNLYLHEIEDFKIVRGDTLRSPGLRQPDGSISRFDVVIANPPFSLANWGGDTWAADPRSFCGLPPMKNGDFAWVQHMVLSMTSGGGRVGVVMPNGALFRSGSEASIRRCLVDQDLVEAVISLPANLFYSTPIPACLLIFRSQKSKERQGHVLFVDASRRYVKVRSQNTLSGEDVAIISDAYRSGHCDAEDGLLVRLVNIEEITANSADLNVSLYLDHPEEELAGTEPTLGAYLDARSTRQESEVALDRVIDSLSTAPQQSEAHWRDRRLGTITLKIGSGATPRGGDATYLPSGVALIRSQNIHDGNFTYEGLAHISDEAAEALRSVTVHEGDVLINITGASVNRVCTVPSTVLPARVNQHVAILRPDSELLSSRFLELLLLRSDIKQRLSRLAESGTTRQALTKTQLANLVLPIPTLAHQERLCYLVSTASSVLDSLNKEAIHLRYFRRALLDEAFASERPASPSAINEGGSRPS